MADDFDWGQLTGDWWLTTAKSIGATERHAKFAAAKHRGCTNTEAARLAGYGAGGTNPGSVRSEGYRLFRSNKISQLLAMAVAESGGGYDGTVTKQESKSILSHLARGSDPSVRIKSIELLNKLEREEEAANNARGEETPNQTVAGIIRACPQYGFGALLSLSLFQNVANGIVNHPFLDLIAPTVAKNFPKDWADFCAQEGPQWKEHLDKMAAGQVFDDAELVAVVTAKAQATNWSAKTKSSLEVASVAE